MDEGTGAAIRGGALRDDQVDQYAAMLARAGRRALGDAGVPLAALTLGNEPGFSADYPSMTMSDEQQMARWRQRVGVRAGPATWQLWAVDHNWADRLALRRGSRTGHPEAFDAASFHCYQRRPRADGRALGAAGLVTECTGTTSPWTEAFALGRTPPRGAEHRRRLHRAADVEPRGRPVAAALATRSPRSGCADCRGLLAHRR